MSIVVTAAAALGATFHDATMFKFEGFIGPGWIACCGLLLAPLLMLSLVLALVPAVPLRRAERAVVIFLPLLYASVALTHWPLRAAFWIHQSSFDDLAERVSQKEGVQPGGRIGWITFRNADLMERNVGFQISGGPGGGVHLVRCARGAEFIWSNPNWIMPLGDEWYLVYED